MFATDFDFDLPEELIAQRPCARREDARLLVVDRSGAGVQHAHIRDLVDLLAQGSLLVVNDTRVLPARLRGVKPTGGRFELLLVEQRAVEADGTEHWVSLGNASKPFRSGPLHLDGDRPPAVELLRVEGELLHLLLRPPASGGTVLEALDRSGEIPLPPYIARPHGPSSDEDRSRYQTVYARTPGAVAAPTAGLHLTEPLLDALAARGVETVAITLHVGLGTFAPLRSNVVSEHRMHEEAYHLSDATCRAIARARSEGRPIVAVGTTVVRALESAVDPATGALHSGGGRTSIFITPGFRFRIVDQLLTNFHLPRSTLMMLVSAFAGRERILDAYREAVTARYRFFSYGDAMLLR